MIDVRVYKIGGEKNKKTKGMEQEDGKEAYNNLRMMRSWDKCALD